MRIELSTVVGAPSPVPAGAALSFLREQVMTLARPEIFPKLPVLKASNANTEVTVSLVWEILDWN